VVLTTPLCGHDLNHGVLAIGYGEEADKTKYWLVKNSWGPDWGIAGCIKVGRGLDKDEGGECGILKMSSYPVLAYEGRSNTMNAIVI